jgi:hypothetical protein
MAPIRTAAQRPVIVTVADGDELGDLRRTVGRRFGSDYPVLDAAGPAVASTRLQAARSS